MCDRAILDRRLQLQEAYCQWGFPELLMESLSPKRRFFNTSHGRIGPSIARVDGIGTLAYFQASRRLDLHFENRFHNTSGSFFRYDTPSLVLISKLDLHIFMVTRKRYQLICGSTGAPCYIFAWEKLFTWYQSRPGQLYWLSLTLINKESHLWLTPLGFRNKYLSLSKPTFNHLNFGLTGSHVDLRCFRLKRKNRHPPSDQWALEQTVRYLCLISIC